MQQAALAAAEQAETAAQDSSEQASRALGSAQATARALLTSKRAECEASEMLERTKNPKDADPVAAELLRVCVLTSMYRQLLCGQFVCVWRLCDASGLHISACMCTWCIPQGRLAVIGASVQKVWPFVSKTTLGQA